jgi:hypothetical protein
MPAIYSFDEKPNGLLEGGQANASAHQNPSWLTAGHLVIQKS